MFWTKAVNQEAKNTSRAMYFRTNHDFHTGMMYVCLCSGIETSLPVFNSPASFTEAAEQS